MGKHCTGRLFPFGSGVDFMPAKTKYAQANHSPRMEYGVFLGYKIHPGGLWSGEYLVADLVDFKDKSLHHTEPHTQFPLANGPHKTNVISLCAGSTVHSPLKQRHDIANRTLKGVERAFHAPTHDVFYPEPPDDKDKVEPVWGDPLPEDESDLRDATSRPSAAVMSPRQCFV